MLYPIIILIYFLQLKKGKKQQLQLEEMYREKCATPYMKHIDIIRFYFCAIYVCCIMKHGILTRNDCQLALLRASRVIPDDYTIPRATKTQ